MDRLELSDKKPDDITSEEIKNQIDVFLSGGGEIEIVPGFESIKDGKAVLVHSVYL